MAQTKYAHYSREDGGRAREEQTKGDEYPGRKSSLFGHSDF